MPADACMEPGGGLTSHFSQLTNLQKLGIHITDSGVRWDERFPEASLACQRQASDVMVVQGLCALQALRALTCMAAFNLIGELCDIRKWGPVFEALLSELQCLPVARAGIQHSHGAEVQQLNHDIQRSR